MKVVITDPARDDIRDIGDYVRQDSPGAASRLVGSLLTACDKLALHPNRYPPVAGLELRRRPHGSYLIFYRVSSIIEIVRILHAARDWTHLLASDND